MATDALTQAAEQLAPSRATTNFFDPTQGADVLARYAGAKTSYEGAQVAADASSKLAASRMDRAAERRRAMLFDRDEADYQDKTEFKAQRGEFLDTIARIDPNADDYDEQISGVIKSLPPAALQDDAMQAILTHKNRIADSVRNEREMQTRREETFQDRVTLQKMRYENDARLTALTPEERASFIDPKTGEFDSVGAGMAAYQKTRGDKKEDSKEMIAERAKVSNEARTLKAAELDRRKVVFEAGIADEEAFPSQVIALQKGMDRARIKRANPSMSDEEIEKRVKGMNILDLKENHAAKLAEAQKYEDTKLESEMASALSREKPEDYVNLVSGASAAAKKKRRDLWDLAHEMAGNAAPDAPAAPTAAKQIDAATATEFLKKAGGDKAKARELARSEGYTF